MYTKQVAIKAMPKTAVRPSVQNPSSPHTSPIGHQQLCSSEQDTALTTGISRILQAGVLCSSLMIVTGLLLLMIQGGGAIPLDWQAFPHAPGQVWSGLLQHQPQAIIASGLFILIATPVLRVMVSVIAFHQEHDRRYALIALILLAILLTSFLLGKGGA